MDTRKIKNIRHSAIKMDKVINDKSTVWKRTITYKVKWGDKWTYSTSYGLRDVFKNYEIYPDGTFDLTNKLYPGESCYSSFYCYERMGERSIRRYKYSTSEYIQGPNYSITHEFYDCWDGKIVEE